jgi:hypothetical protein
MLALFPVQPHDVFGEKQEERYAVVPNGSVGCLDVVAGP